MMGKPSNIIDLGIARELKEAARKPTAQVMAEFLDKVEGMLHKVPKENMVPFSKDFPLVKKVLGCERASALFSRIEYRFNIMPNGFYKFLAPCKNKYYRKGDSLAEEMELHRDTILVASKKIVTAYKSKSLYEAAKSSLGEIGAFKGMPYLSYLDNNTHQTFYLRNAAVADLILEGKNPFKKKIFKNIRFHSYDTVFKLLKVKIPERHVQEIPERAFRKFRNAGAPEPAVYKASPAPTKNTCKEYSFSISPSEPEPLSEAKTPNPIREEEIKNVILEEQPGMHATSEMVKIWIKHTGPMNGLSPKTVVLEECLEDQFNGSLDKWDGYCKMVAKSKFLMGETGKGNFKAYLGWAIKPENIEDVLSGDRYDQDRSISSTIVHDAKQIAEEEEKEILSLDIPENIRELRLRLLRGVGGATYRSWMKDCLIDQIGDHSVDFKPQTQFMSDWFKAKFLGHIRMAVVGLFQNVTIENVKIELDPSVREQKIAEICAEETPPKVQAFVAPTETPINPPVVNKKWEESIRMDLLRRVGSKKESS